MSVTLIVGTEALNRPGGLREFAPGRETFLTRPELRPRKFAGIRSLRWHLEENCKRKF